MTAFVILHYRAAEMTRTCVERIRALNGSNYIVIVDNASPNGTGELLAEEYAGEDNITVLLNQENAGFARGNNLGIRWVCENLKADFVVVLNNDVEILQKDFAVRIGEIYRENPFDVLKRKNQSAALPFPAAACASRLPDCFSRRCLKEAESDYCCA